MANPKVRPFDAVGGTDLRPKALPPINPNYRKVRPMAAREGSAGPTHKCEKCSQVTEWLATLPRFGEQPTYDIFRCAACGHVNWVAQEPRPDQSGGGTAE